MTTVIWDGKQIATDSRMIEGSFKSQGPFKKMFANSDYTKILALAGAIDWVYNRMEWLLANMPELNLNTEELIHKIPKGEDNFELLLIDNGMGYSASGGFNFVPVTAPYALGSGGEYALGAFHAGATIEESIEAAANFDIYTDANIVVYDCKLKPKRKARALK